MRKRTVQFLLIVLVVGMFAVTTSTYGAKNSEQIVFSTPGFFGMTLDHPAPNGEIVTPLGFWVWCQAEGGGPGKGIYAVDQACQGSMYFYFLGHPEHVFGAAFLGDGSGVKENNDGTYTMTVNADDFRCTLQNLVADPNKSLTNTVVVDCTFKNKFAGAVSGHADVTNSIVQVTGPGE